MTSDGVSLWTTVKVSVVIAVAPFVAVLLLMLGIVLLAFASLVVAVDRLVSGRRRDIRLGRLLVIELTPKHHDPTGPVERGTRR